MTLQTSSENPIGKFLEHQGVMILDGGLATELEARGCNLDDELWSARMLLDGPDEILRVHLDYLAAGADCIITSTYQASLPGFRKRGLGEDRGIELLRRSVQLALEARDVFWGDPETRKGRLRPLIAASVGPYGAFLADGSEYTGDYGISDGDLRTFHQIRWAVLADSPVDLLACETIPSRQEAEVLLQLLRETRNGWAWLSFSCRDGLNLCDGSRLTDVARDCDTEPGVAAVGINCTSPEFIASLISEARRATDKPIVVYPNSGERYDAHRKAWVEVPSGIDWDAAALEWARLGASGIGGCCRIGPERIAALRRRLVA